MECIDSDVWDPGEIFKYIYLFGCARSSLWHTSWCSMWDLGPRSGMEPGPPASGAQNLPWTTEEVPGPRGNFDFKDILTLLMNTNILFKIYTNT